MLLVTGAAGFIGSNFTRWVVAHHPQPMILLDVMSYAADLTRIEDLIQPGTVEFIQGDICDAALVDRLFKTHNITRVVHFAAETHVDRSIHDPRTFIRTNIEGTFNLLEGARRQWLSPSSRESVDHRFLHVSTDEVFGALGENDPPFVEESLYRPNSPYSASKAGSDHLVRAWGETYGLPVVITNCSNNYGPWQYPEKLIPLMILNALEGKDLPIYGDGLQIRDWIHVEDHCRGIWSVLNQGVLGESYLMGGDSQVSNLSLVNQICEVVDRAGKRTPGSTAKQIRFVKDRPGHDRRYAIDSSKILSQLGWKPEHNIGDDLESLVSWYSMNFSWADKIRGVEYGKFYAQQYEKSQSNPFTS